MKRIIAVLTLLALVFLMGCDELAKDLTSTISGTVYDGGEIVPNALVLLLSPGDTITAGLSLSNATVGRADGTYILVDVITGDHVVCAVKDVNSNLTVDAGVDLVGYHGEVDTTLGISIPQAVTIETDGDDLENIDIDEMFILPGEGHNGKMPSCMNSSPQGDFLQKIPLTILSKRLFLRHEYCEPT